jgi:hypothetical protein
MKWLTALLLLSLAAACGDPGNDVLVVVQETNMPEPPPPCDGFAYDYEINVVTECDLGDREVHVCTDQELCEEQLDELVEPLRTCEQVHGYEAEIPDGC